MKIRGKIRKLFSNYSETTEIFNKKDWIEAEIEVSVKNLIFQLFRKTKEGLRWEE